MIFWVKFFRINAFSHFTSVLVIIILYALSNLLFLHIHIIAINSLCTAMRGSIQCFFLFLSGELNVKKIKIAILFKILGRGHNRFNSHLP